MAYVATDGPPDVDATHAWAPAAGPAPPTLNVAGTGGSPPVLPWIKVLAIDGWRDMPEVVDNRAPRTFGVGEVAYPARTLGKTVVYQLEVRAVSRESVRGTLSACLTGFGANTNEGTMTVTPFTVPGGVAWTFTGRVIALDSDSTFTLAPAGLWGRYRWGLTVTIRMSDPHFYTSAVGYL